MTGAQLKEVLGTALPRDKVLDLARELKVVERESVVELDMLVNALVLSAQTPSGGRQADVLRAYCKASGGDVERSTFYARFNTKLESLLERLLRDAMAAAQRDPVLLPHCLQGVTDWIAIDSETVRLHDALKSHFPGTGDYAALKVHKAFSLGRHNAIDFEISPAKHHDSTHFSVTEAQRGYGLLMDLGYASHERLRACSTHGVSFVVKLKTGWKARLEDVDQGHVDKLFRGTDLVDALAYGQLACEDGVIDADVSLSQGRAAYSLRLVALETPEKGICFFLTNLPRDKYPAKVVGDLYRLRWEIEKNNKVDKSDFRLADLDCRKPCSALTMVYAALLGSNIANRLVHADHRALVEANEPLRRGPAHVRLLALALASMHASLTEMLHADTSDEEWERDARLLRHMSRDPNWRRRPSVLDTLLGLTAAPGRPRRQKAIRSARE